MEILPQLPTTRRVVTGHNRGGKAIFEFDEALQPLSLTASKAAFESEGASRPVGFTLIHRTRGYPAKIQGSSEELTPDNLRRGQGEPGIVCEIVDLPPTSKQQAAFLHRNQSLDYGVVLKGSMQLILDDGVQKTLNEGDVYVQKGTLHGWKNESSEYCRFFTVVIPSEKVKVANNGEILEAVKIPALTD